MKMMTMKYLHDSCIHLGTSFLSQPTFRNLRKSQIVTFAMCTASTLRAPQIRSATSARIKYEECAFHQELDLDKSKHAGHTVLHPTGRVYYNLPVCDYYKLALKHEKDSCVVSSGALSARSYEKTGRSPKDKRIVHEPSTAPDIWWGKDSPNHPMDEEAFFVNRRKGIEHLNNAETVFVVDAFANWDSQARKKVRVICSRPYHALFMHNMLIRATPEELESFGEPDLVIYNAGEAPADPDISPSGASVALNLQRGELVILGTQYAGEMKKGVFTFMNYLLPKQGILSLHSGCNIGERGDVSLFFGLSGTGKTTLSTDPRRPLIGDDEHGWGDNGVFNIEGGCYAKCIHLQESKEPEIFSAIRFGTVLENIAYDPDSMVVDFDSVKYTENTRASYPIEHISNANIPCIGPHPKNIIMLCCDAYGVLPPVSKLTLEQAMYWFVSGYTAKIAGTEQGVTEPEATFSACFGAAFLAWHPMKYGQMLSEKMQAHGTTAWLVNTGYMGGAYGQKGSSRISLKHTRAIVDAIHSGELADSSCSKYPVFDLQVPDHCSGVPSEMLHPQTLWKDREEFDSNLKSLGQRFAQNFSRFSDGSQHIEADVFNRMAEGGPML